MLSLSRRPLGIVRGELGTGVQVLRVNNRVIPLQSDALVVDIRRLEPDCRSLRQGRDPRSEPLGWLWLGSCWLATFRLAFWLPL